MGGLVLRQGQADDVDVVLFDGPAHGGAPAAADVEQRHPGLQAQLAQRQVDLGDLGLFQGHVVALEVGAAVGLGRVQEQPEEVDLGDLGLFQGHVVALEVGAAVGLGRVQEQPEELVGQVVVRLYLVEMRSQLLSHDRVPFWPP